jgi:ABC-type Fe3+-hydroxamate transport system substrate-binding protein
MQPFPTRIISLVPSQTELLFDLGLGEEVTGITKFCVRPEQWHRSKTRVGGTKNSKMEIIHQLKPDLIIANKEENTKEQIDELSRNYRVWVTDIKTLNDALKMIRDIGELVNKKEQANSLAKQIASEFSRLETQLQTTNNKAQTAYLIWHNPYMAAGGDTFINDMLTRCGLENIFKQKNRYPEITAEELRKKNCELLLLSSEPFPFKEKHIAELKQQLPAAKIILVDGEMFSWYGSRLLHAPGYFLGLIKELQE